VKGDAIKKYQKRLELAYKYTVNKAIEDSRLCPNAQCTVCLHSHISLCTARLPSRDVSQRQAMHKRVELQCFRSALLCFTSC